MSDANLALVEGEPDETCVFEEPDCGEIVMYDSGEPWRQRCKDRYREEQIAAGFNDPERPLP